MGQEGNQEDIINGIGKGAIGILVEDTEEPISVA